MTWPEAVVIVASIGSFTWLISLIIDRYEPRFTKGDKDDDE